MTKDQHDHLLCLIEQNFPDCEYRFAHNVTNKLVEGVRYCIILSDKANPIRLEIDFDNMIVLDIQSLY